MSTFSGKMKELDDVSIDNFEGENLKSHVYFLSHCHWDHMQGINYSFLTVLQNNNAFIYMSSVSKTIFENMFPYLSPKIKTLDIPGKNFIDIPNTDKTIAVTLIPAGHCPGSVMFLFESNKTLLYTGDIRIRAKELQKFNQLYDFSGNLKRIDNIYLDTTFFLKGYEHFPLREESITEFCKLINNWLEKDEMNVVSINTPANYGSEYLFIEIFKRCQQPIHVANKKYNVYKYFPEMDNAITLKSSETKIHNDCDCIKEIMIQKYKLHLKPSALRWRNHDFKNGIVEKHFSQYYVCYSSHSSYNEIMDILKLLKPLKISPCVLPSTAGDNNEMLDTIQEVLEEIHKRDYSSDTEDSNMFENKTIWENNAKKCSDEFNDEDFFGFLDSPDSKRQKTE